MRGLEGKEEWRASLSIIMCHLVISVRFSIMLGM